MPTPASERGSRLLAGGAIASHPDGRTMLTDASDKRALLWQVSADAEPLADGGTNKKATPTGSVANRRWRGFNAFRSGLLRADGQIAVSLADGAGGQELIRLSDPATGRPSGRPAPHYPGWIVRAVAFSPDGRCFATGSNPDDSLRGRGPTLGREHGPVAAPADAAHQLGRGTGIPARRQGRWPRAITTDSSGSGIPRPARKSAGRFLRERSS